MGVNGEALQLHAVYKKPYFLLQVTRESVIRYYKSRENLLSGTTSHVRTRIRYYKSRALHLNVHNEIEGSYDKIFITIVPSYTRKKYHSFVAIGIVTRAAHS